MVHKICNAIVMYMKNSLIKYSCTQSDILRISIIITNKCHWHMTMFEVVEWILLGVRDLLIPFRVISFWVHHHFNVIDGLVYGVHIWLVSRIIYFNLCFVYLFGLTDGVAFISFTYLTNCYYLPSKPGTSKCFL